MRRINTLVEVTASIVVPLVILLVFIAFIFESVDVMVVSKDLFLLEVLVVLGICVFLILVLFELLILKVVALPFLLLLAQVGHVLVEIIFFGQKCFSSRQVLLSVEAFTHTLVHLLLRQIWLLDLLRLSVLLW